MYEAFITSFLVWGEGRSLDYRQLTDFCKEFGININIINLVDYIKSMIDDYASILCGASYDDDVLYNIGFKSNIKVLDVENFEYLKHNNRCDS